MTIGTKTAIGDRPHRITIQRRLDPVPDGKGGWTEQYEDRNPPQMWGKVAPASQVDLERSALGLQSGTTLTTASRLVTMPFHPDVTTLDRILWSDRHAKAHTGSVTGVSTNADETETVLLCEELS